MTRIMRRVVDYILPHLVFVLMLMVAVPAATETLKDGFAAYDEEDYATAHRIWKPMVEQGDALEWKPVPPLL
jgi:hypothetical protein